jgi:hypothetical protein
MGWFKHEEKESRTVRISIDRDRQEIVAAALRARDAGLVDQAYASMATLTELLYEMDEELTTEERELLSLCVKLYVDQRRTALSAVSEREGQEQDPHQKQALHQSKLQVSLSPPRSAEMLSSCAWAHGGCTCSSVLAGAAARAVFQPHLVPQGWQQHAATQPCKG